MKAVMSALGVIVVGAAWVGAAVTAAVVTAAPEPGVPTDALVVVVDLSSVLEQATVASPVINMIAITERMETSR